MMLAKNNSKSFKVPGAADDGPVHVYPLYGKEHQIAGDARCWCNPEWAEEPSEQSAGVLIHHGSQ